MQAFAASVFAANGTPQVQINSTALPVRSESDLTRAKAFCDLYDLVDISNSAKGLPQRQRIVAIEHDITPEGWTIKQVLARPTSVALPQRTPAVR